MNGAMILVFITIYETFRWIIVQMWKQSQRPKNNQQ